MGRYFGQFATSGDPNGGDLPHWPPTSAGQIQCLEPASIGGVRSIPVSTYLDEHKVAFWRSLMSQAPSKAA
jgi:para-nitrobenzyl esterase